MATKVEFDEIVTAASPYNVVAYGAIGDGSADDTVAVQAACTACAAAGGGVVFFPEGDYKLTSTVTFSKCFLKGVGWDNTLPGGSRILFDAASTALYATVYRSGVEGIRIQKVAAYAPGDAQQVGSIAIHINEASMSYVRNVSIGSQETAIKIDAAAGSYFHVVDSCEFQNTATGVHILASSAAGIPPNGARIINNDFRGAGTSTTAIKLAGNATYACSYIWVQNNEIENWTTVFDLTYVSGCHFLHNENENYTNFFNYALGEQVVNGTHDGGDGQASMTDSGATFTIDALIGRTVYNQTDGSSGPITDNTGINITATLAGGTDNDWDDDDIYTIQSDAVACTYEAGGGCLPASTKGFLPASHNAPTSVEQGSLYADGQSASRELDGSFSWLENGNRVKTILMSMGDVEALGTGLFDDNYIGWRFAAASGGLIVLDDQTEKARIEKNGNFVSQGYYWKEEFDAEDNTTAINNWVSNRWTIGGTNDNVANVTIASGSSGRLNMITAGADNDSVYIQTEKRLFAARNPKMEFKFQLYDVSNSYMAIGFTVDGYDDKGTPANDYIALTFDSDNDTNWMLRSVDSGTGGADIAGDTSVVATTGAWTCRIDLTDTEQPRLWLNGTEVTTGLDSNTALAAGQFRAYIMVQTLNVAQEQLDVNYIMAWADR